MTDRPGLDFSFSGLKTFTRNTLANLPTATDQDKADVARAFEDAVVDTLLIKCRRALEQTGLDQLVMAGGVAANTRLRAALDARLPGRVFYAPAALCTDNGAMVAFAGYLRLAHGEQAPLAIETRARWPLDELDPRDKARDGARDDALNEKTHG